MSHRSDCFHARSSRVNIQQAALYSSIRYLLTASQVELDSFQIPRTMSDSKSVNTSLLEVMVSSWHQWAFIRDVSDLTLQIIFDALWASTNVGSQCPIAWKNSRHAPRWRFNLHCGIEEKRITGIVCIICHRARCHPSDHGTSWIGNHLLAKHTSQS